MVRQRKKGLVKSAVVLFLLICSSIFLLSACSFLQVEEQVIREVSGELVVHYIDVGQGDATLLKGPDFTLLIDAGRHDRSELVPYLKKVGVEQLDLFILTHPHADHIGQAAQVLDTFPTQEVWMSGDVHTSKTYERLLNQLLASDIAYHEPRAGEVYDLGSLQLEVVHPQQLTGDLNGGSISVRAVYGQLAFLFTGDAEREQEAEMIERGHVLDAHILQLGHHGSSTSSTEAFLDAVNPEVAIYSAEEGNSYGHPHREVVERMEELGIPLYGTDKQGTIILLTDGSTYTIETEK